MRTDFSQRFEQRVKAFIDSARLITGKRAVLVALSGGADSVALLRVLLALGFRCGAAHCNFHLRGEESDRDERFVRAFCATMQVPLQVKHFDVPAYMSREGVSMEMACRDLRYDWFFSLLHDLDCEALAVAHHQNDNVETFFINALRGSGVSGLAGMAPKNGAVVRPLLCVSRSDVEEYLKDIGQDYVVDSTNLKSDVKRNKLRNIILPAMEQCFPGAKCQLGKTVSMMQSCHSLYAELVGKAKNEICRQSGDVLYVDFSKLLSFANHGLLLFEILKPFGFNYAQCTDILAAIQSGDCVGKHFFSSSFTLTIQRANLEVFVNESTLECAYATNLKCNKITSPIEIDIKIADCSQFSLKNCDGKSVIALDLSVTDAKNVVIRHWRHGDRFRPFGMKGSKLLSDLFTDLKLSEREKRQVWLMEADGEIIWVIGYRASTLYKVNDTDEAYLVLSLVR